VITRSATTAAWRDVLVALDVGTTGARAAAFDLHGNRRLEVRRPYPTTSLHPGWAEQDAGAWRNATLSALRQLVAEIGPRRRIHGIGLTGQCPSVVIVDDRHRPLRPALIYRDNRATQEAAQLRAEFGDAQIHALTGHLPAAFHVLPKLLWLRRHEAAAFRAAALALQPRDWIALVLTSEAVTDGSHAAATLAFDLRARSWSSTVLDRVGIGSSLFPRLGGSSEVVGTLRPEIADRIGMSAKTPVVLGGADSQACALGVGVVSTGPVSEMAGSSTCLNAAVDRPLDVLAVTHYPHVVGSGLTTETGINTTGAAIAWVAGSMYAGRRGRPTESDWAALDRDVREVPAGSDGVLVLPVLGDGERTDADLRGAITGLSLRHDRATIARATLEGVAFAIRDELALLTVGGVAPTELRISGGDARLGSWNRIKSDVARLPVRSVAGDAAVTGVAMLAGIGAGVYTSADDAIGQCVRLDPAIEPDPAAADRYDEAFEAWRRLAQSQAVRRPS
jgi:xylulokinase